MNPINNNLTNLKSQLKIEPEKLSHSLWCFINGCMEKLEREGIILGLFEFIALLSVRDVILGGTPGKITLLKMVKGKSK